MLTGDLYLVPQIPVNVSKLAQCGTLALATTCDDWEPEMRLVQTEMSCRSKNIT